MVRLIRNDLCEAVLVDRLPVGSVGTIISSSPHQIGWFCAYRYWIVSFPSVTDCHVGCVDKCLQLIPGRETVAWDWRTLTQKVDA